MTTLTASMEDYLEAILIIGLEKKVTRVKDIAKYLCVKTSSVANAVKVLSEKELVHQEPYGYVELTQKGVLRAKEIYERHKTLYKFFNEILGVDSKVADQDACEIEHHIHRETLDRILKFIQLVETCPEGEPLWLSSFHYYVKHGKKPEHCQEPETIAKGGARMRNLGDLKVGQRGKVTRVIAEAGIKRKLLDMGIVPGVEIKIQKVAPLGDPVDVLVKGYHLSLRREEAETISVEEVNR
ncbi:MAG: DtxR family transcriptional regulator [Deltaproteobacteria bacterium]|nr:metal-dependent transcriptional regulator [Deltaproteobacteria bacterium]MBW2077432.1 metal-dependent transcriptional regulator [Deltaproteobacteria bacterium]MBW2312036.1 metal-dependent transcriptional regulator [Deltaproteobacteria bacterium]RLB31832.1 MAG: DtxR family transcriptional regulator [Deltaproteobacteria bacterium]